MKITIEDSSEERANQDTAKEVGGGKWEGIANDEDIAISIVLSEKLQQKIYSL